MNRYCVTDSFGQRGSTGDMLGQDMFSFDGDNMSDGDDDYERLSEFDEVCDQPVSHSFFFTDR